MFKLVSIICLSLLASCAMFQKEEPKNYEILTGDINPDTLTPEQIKKELTLKDTMAVRSYEIKVMPLIDSYIKRAEIGEDLLKELPSTEDKTCFLAEVKIDTHNPKTADFKSWKAEAINYEDDLIDMQWTPVSMERVPVEKVTGGYTGSERRFSNKGILCAVDKMTLNKFFQVKLSPQIVQWPLKSDVVFTWNVPEKKMVNGKGG